MDKQSNEQSLERSGIFSKVQDAENPKVAIFSQRVSKEDAARICKETTERELAKLHEQLKDRDQRNKFVAPQMSDSDPMSMSDVESSTSEEQIYVPRVSKKKKRKHSDKTSTTALKHLVQKQESIIRMNSKMTKLKLDLQAFETKLHYTQLDLSSVQADLQKEKKGTEILLKKLATANLANTKYRGEITFISIILLVHLLIHTVYASGFTNEMIAIQLNIPPLWIVVTNCGFWFISALTVLIGLTT